MKKNQKNRPKGPLKALLYFVARCCFRVLTLLQHSLRAYAPQDDLQRSLEIEPILGQEAAEFMARSIDTLMIPRSDIVALPVSASYEDVARMFLRTGFRWLPVFRDTLDTIAGIVTLQCILSLKESDHEEEKWYRHVHSPAFYPTSLTVQDALHHMYYSHRSPVLFVVDEYGGIEGMVTKGQVMRGFFHLYAEEGAEEVGLILESGCQWLVDGRADLETVSHELRLESVFSKEDFERFNTMGGWVCGYAGRVPLTGEVITHPSGLVVEIRHSNPRRVFQMAVTLPWECQKDELYHVASGENLCHSANAKNDDHEKGLEDKGTITGQSCPLLSLPAPEVQTGDQELNAPHPHKESRDQKEKKDYRPGQS